MAVVSEKQLTSANGSGVKEHRSDNFSTLGGAPVNRAEITSSLSNQRGGPLAPANVSDWKNRMACFFADKTDAQLQAVELWVKDCRQFNTLLKQYPKLGQALLNKADDQIFNELVHLSQELSAADYSKLETQVVSVSNLLSLAPMSDSPEYIDFVFRGQNPKNQIMPSVEPVKVEQFLAASLTMNGSQMYSRGGTELLAVYMPGAGPGYIPIPQSWTEVGFTNEIANIRGLTISPKNRNLGGFGTNNHEVVFMPGQSMIMAPNVVQWHEHKVRPAIVLAAGQEPKTSWSSVQEALNKKLEQN